MKVKSLYPTIISDNPEETIKFYEKLGFEKKHDALTNMGSHVYVLNNEDLEIEIVEYIKDYKIPLTPGLHSLRMNVSDIEEAYKEFQASGVKIIKPPFETSVGKNLFVKDDQGINITLVEHI